MSAEELWKCSRCTFLNQPEKHLCEMCEYPRGGLSIDSSDDFNNLPLTDIENDVNLSGYEPQASDTPPAQSDSDDGSVGNHYNRPGFTPPNQSSRRPPPAASKHYDASTKTAQQVAFQRVEVDVGADHQQVPVQEEEEEEEEVGDPWVAAQVQFTQVQEELLSREYLYFKVSWIYWMSIIFTSAIVCLFVSLLPSLLKQLSNQWQLSGTKRKLLSLRTMYC